MKSHSKQLIFAILVLATAFTERSSGQAPVRTSQESNEEVRKARAAVEAHPDSLELFKVYIQAVGISNPTVIKLYNSWMKLHPKNANFPLAMGAVYYESELPEAKKFLLKAVSIDPKNPTAWFMLSMDASRWGRNDQVTQYLRKATLADPSNADYAAYYLMSMDGRNIDYKQKVFDYINLFPTSEHGAQMLYLLAEGSANLNDKVNYFEILRNKYPPQKFSWSAAGMLALADAYMQTDLEKAIVLINIMGDEKDWVMRKQIADLLQSVNKSERDQKYKQAVDVINHVKLPLYNELSDFIALKKSALLEKAGEFEAAYDSLSIKFAKLPTDELLRALTLYGNKIGKDERQINNDVKVIRYSKATVAYPFELEGYNGDRRKLNLNDLKGKVVLLTFWFPGCGPCRTEFPYLQAAIDKFKGTNIAYVGVNVEPRQDAYVLPFVQNNKYSFIPLRSNSDFAKKNYKVWGEPENFLIDQDGKIIFKRFHISNTNQRTLELMIASLLQKKEQSN